ncbi:hypothetical protein ACWGID_32510 [Kribbella sp. NPDC054772]
MAPVGEPEAFVPRPGDLIEIRENSEYWQFGRDEERPGTWQHTIAFETDGGPVLTWVNAHGGEPSERMQPDRQYLFEHGDEGPDAKEWAIVRDESGELRIEEPLPAPEPLDLAGAEPFRLRSGDKVATNDRGVFSYHGTDNAGAERWHAEFQGGISVEVPGAPFQPGEQSIVVRQRDGDDLEFTVAQGDDGLVLVPGVEQPAIDETATAQGVSGPAGQSTQTDAGERTYGAHSTAAQNRKQSPSAGR